MSSNLATPTISNIMILTVPLFLTILAMLVLLIATEITTKHYRLHSEFSRKFVHIVVGSFIAFWPFFLSWNQIKLLSLLFIFSVLISKWFHIFDAIHNVSRPTWGEVCFAVAVGLITLLTQSKAIYAAALLHMGLADGMAAVIGVRYGARHRYSIFGHYKSVAGTVTFLLLSLVILTVFSLTSHIALLIIVALAIGTTLIENVGINGLDNLLVPVIIAAVLTKLS